MTLAVRLPGVVFAFEKLLVYQKSVALTDAVCGATRTFPRGYLYLADQLNRAALSIATNLAEGNGRSSAAPPPPALPGRLGVIHQKQRGGPASVCREVHRHPVASHATPERQCDPSPPTRNKA